MASRNPNKNLYPQVIQSNPDSTSPFSSNTSSQSSIYPSIEMEDLAENLFPDNNQEQPPGNTSFEASEEILIKIPGSIIHLIDKQQSLELACGELNIVRLKQGDNVVAVLARVGEQIQWPLAKDEAAVKLDNSHYFFTLRIPSDNKKQGMSGSDLSDDDDDGDGYAVEYNVLNYGLTVASKGQESKLRELDLILEEYSAFSVKAVAEKVGGGSAAVDVSPEEMVAEVGKRELVAGNSAAYWTTLAPNVEDYSGSVARMIAAGSGQLIKGILWCGDVTVDRLKWGNEFLKKRLKSGYKSEISPEAMRRMKRVKKLTKMSEVVATGILSGVVRVSGFFTSSIVNSKVGKKFFNLIPGEIILASLDSFNKVCDAVEVTGRNVMSTTSTVTTGLVSQKYGEQAAEVTNEGFCAAGHAIGTAWAVFKIRKALNPKRVIKPTTLVKAAANESRNSAKFKSKSS